ncbi:unnamed protein product [Mycena citricolor]|uniref:Uncharacterized protein n=1 Tax=Mycena citricolor TaxID=2018698 RepID=A0AAD2JXL5_9AGAR|nr:unnamed protein product [Mycena citricolor]
MLRVRIHHDPKMLEAASSICNACKQIFEIGALTADKLALAILLSALSDNALCHICVKYKDDSTATPANIVAMLEKEKIWLKKELKKQAEEEERANVARAQVTAKTAIPMKLSLSGRLCGTCRGYHCTEDCWAEGGKKTEVKSGAKPGGKQLALQGANGKLVYFTVVEGNSNIAVTALVPATTSGPDRDNPDDTSNAKLEKIYATYHQNHSHSSSTAFSTFSMVVAKDIPNNIEHIFLTRAQDSYAADFGATAHILPEH